MPDACAKNVYGVCTTFGKFEHLHTPLFALPHHHVYNLTTYTRVYTHYRGVVIHMVRDWLSSVSRQLYPISTWPIISKAN
jgi:hypothetical protein